MSGIPGMGQRWQAVLKIRVIMIPLPENTAAGAASGDSCGVKGCCRVFRQPCRAVLTYSVPHRGRENYKFMAGLYALSWRVGIIFLCEEGFQIQIVEKGRAHTYFVIPDCRGIRHHGRETPDKRIYRTRQKILFQM